MLPSKIFLKLKRHSVESTGMYRANLVALGWYQSMETIEIYALNVDYTIIRVVFTLAARNKS